MKCMEIHTEEQLKEALAIRFQVFVDEQGVNAEVEKDQYDTLDSGCTHVLVLWNEKPIGTGRVRKKDGQAKIERVCIVEKARGLGAGVIIMQKLEEIAATKGYNSVFLNAQLQAKSFYERLGYTVVSPLFYEENIPHISMNKQL